MADFDFVESNGHDSGGVALDSVVFDTADVTAGNLVFAVCARGAGPLVTSIAQSAGTATLSAFTRRVELNFVEHAEIWSALVTGSGSCTVLFSFNAVIAAGRLMVAEYVAPAAGFLFVGSSRKANTPAVLNPDSGDVELEDDGLIFAAMGPTTVGITPTAGAGFTIRESSASDGFNIEDGKFAAGVRAARWTITPADPCGAIVVAFQRVQSPAPAKRIPFVGSFGRRRQRYGV